MNVLEALKTLYVGGGGDASDLDEISGNKDPNMINAIYGDGLNTRLSEGVADNVRNIAKGGGGGDPVYLYVLDHAIESDDTLPPIPEEFSGYHWEISEFSYAVSLSENGTALKFGELGEIFKQGSPIYIVQTTEDPGYGTIIQSAYGVQYAENVYRWNDEESYHVCAVFSGANYTSIGVWADLIEG